MTVINNPEMTDHVRPFYTEDHLDSLDAYLDAHDVVTFVTRPSSGLFAASRPSAFIDDTKYDRSWVRDNVYAAYAHLVAGETDVARGTLASLFDLYAAQAGRIEAALSGAVDLRDHKSRPYVRGWVKDDGGLEFEDWTHGQNDAHGYFVWLASLMASRREFDLLPARREVLDMMVRYFGAIEYWHDEDCGHWEEAKKIEASSIGVVVAGLREYEQMCRAEAGGAAAATDAAGLRAKGQEALQEILPAECVQRGRERAADAALLFLIAPLHVIDGAIADAVISGVETELKGDYGIKRYLGDTFWGPDYDKQDRATWTADVSDDMSRRDAIVPLRRGVDEAQWCIFDSALSAALGERFVAGGSTDVSLLERQIHYFNRALGQITGPGAGDVARRCPELYYRKDGAYVHNPATPLLWSQANLVVAMQRMKESAQAAAVA